MADDKWLEEILKNIHADINRVEDKLDKGFGQMNNRVRSLEIWRGYVLGIGTVIAIGVSLVIKYLL